LVLQESPDVTTIFPIMTLEEDGGILVSEHREDQVRVYSSTGALLAVLGRGMENGSSIHRPYQADRLPNGSIAVTSVAPSRLHVVSASSGQPSRDIDVPIRPLFGVVALDSFRLLLIGWNGRYPTELLHIWDLRSGRVVKSFFPPPTGIDSNVVNALGQARVARHGERIAAIHQLCDSLTLFDLQGRAQRRMALPVSAFRVPHGPLPDLASPAERIAWADQFTYLLDVFWFDSTRLVVQWVTGSGPEAVFGLVQVDTLGRQVWSLSRTPRLLGIRDSIYYFDNPQAVEANHLLVAQEEPELRH
jgi:hypothetical protein